MDSERPHRTTNKSNNSTSELFICFTSRLSSSSMKLSSKSLLSPSRCREPSQISLSTSLSRRLRNNGSIKGGQASPMFPTGGKKRGTFENPEPSSPKVTCIGQVRVKTKKQGKKIRTRSMRRGEASFRRTEQSFQVSANANPDLNQQNTQSFQLQNLQGECSPHRNQRWVHLPLTICEALRAVGAEFSCLFPCRSSCMSNEREKEDEAVRPVGSGGGHGRESSCGAAVARWLMALEEGEEAKGREIELLMGEEDRRDSPERSQRRHVFEDLDINIDNNKNEEFLGEEEEEKARVSICIPPKNALLLMRCRSDPVKMAALANRFWEPPVQKEENDEDDDNGDDEEDEEEKQLHMEEEEELQEKIEVTTEEVAENSTICEVEVEQEPVVEEEEGCDIENREIIEINGDSEVNQEKLEVDDKGDDGGSNVNEQDETSLNISSPEAGLDLKKTELEEGQQEGEEKLEKKETNEKNYNEETSFELASSSAVSGASSDSQNDEVAATTAEMDETENSAETAEESTEEEEKEKETAEKPWEEEEAVTRDRSESDSDDPNVHVGPEAKETEYNPLKTEKKSTVLPECLLLMMCEPKLSMEVSKETWVCSTDFVRWIPDRPSKKDGGNEPKKRISNESKPSPPPPPQLLQPPRSSCSFPVAPGGGMSMASMIEQKLVGSNGYEPFVLTRCKSEPMRSSAKFAPDACFWKNRKLEPHRPATVGAAGVGF